MNTRYFATFTSGVQEIIGNRLQKYPNAELKVESLEDGLVIFESSMSSGQLTELRFFNNVFLLLADMGQQSSIDAAAQKAAESDMSGLPQKAGFKIHTRQGSQTVGLQNLQALQGAVADANGGMPDSFKPDIELLLWVRNDGRALWGQQLQRPGFKMRKLEPGELRPELAHAMGLLASLDHKDTVLDPFAGYGAIVRECAQGFHCEEVVGVEYNEHLVPHLKSIPGVIAKHGDAARLPHIETRSVDRVITDPPWGKFEPAGAKHLEHLYYEAMVQMHRVLRIKGCIVLLTSLDFIEKLASEIGFTIEKQYNVLVNGQKASLYKLRKLAA